VAALGPPFLFKGTAGGTKGTHPVLPGFTGEYQQRVDGKGRMSIPAEFRRVLEEGDAEARDQSRNPSVYVQYGPHLQGKRLNAMTVDAFAAISQAIMAIRPRTPEERDRKTRAQYAVLSQTVRLEVDRDGRVVLPIAQREKMGLTEGEVVFAGIGDSFEIWPAAVYDAEVRAPLATQLADLGPGYDPMTDIWQLTG